MELKARAELRKLIAPSLRQSLKLLAMPLLELRQIVEEELVNNPLLEEYEPQDEPPASLAPEQGTDRDNSDYENPLNFIAQKTTLQDMLLRQLGIFTNTDEEFRLGQEIIGNIDENGYLAVAVDEMAGTLNIPPDKVESVLKLIQTFEPAGVGARTPAECLLIQLEMQGEKDPLLKKLVESRLEDIAKKDLKTIARALKQPQDKIESLVKKILKLNPKPGLTLSPKETNYIIPDIIIEEKGDDLEITLNDEHIPHLGINKTYRDMLKKNDLENETREFLIKNFRSAIELLKAISKRRNTLRRVTETIAQFQKEAIRKDLSYIRPLTMKDIANRLNLHESTVCRVILNKYVRLPQGIIALKDLFAGSINDKDGNPISSNYIKRLLKEFIEKEDKKHPLSDEDIAGLILTEYNLKVSRRAIAKYRQGLKLLSSTFRRQR